MSVIRPSHRRRQIAASAAVVLVGWLGVACTSQEAPAHPRPTKGMSLAQCLPYGVPAAPVTLKLPGMVLYANAPVEAKPGSTALVAFNELPGVRSVSSSATVFVGPASSAPDLVQEGMLNANIAEHSDWGVDIVDKNAITVRPLSDNTQATKVSHSTFTTRHGSASATFDYWVFTASGQRYLLSYARRPAARTPDAATFFATATSCPKATS